MDDREEANALVFEQIDPEPNDVLASLEVQIDGALVFGLAARRPRVSLGWGPLHPTSTVGDRGIINGRLTGRPATTSSRDSTRLRQHREPGNGRSDQLPRIV